MGIVGIGTEIVECVRIGRLIEQHGELFLERVYTAREIRECQARRRTTEHFAARWAAKEAVLKAIGMERAARVGRTNLEIRQKAGGRAKVYVRGVVRDEAIRRGIWDILVDLAYCRNYATAYAMAVAGVREAGGADSGTDT